MSYRLFIFDFDGTLADSFLWFCEALNDASERFGYRRLEDDEIMRLRGCDNRAILRDLQVSSWKIPGIARHLRGRMAEDAARIPLFPGVSRLFRSIRDHGGGIAIVSSNQESTIIRILGTQIASDVSHFACGASLFGKAAKFKRVMEQSRVQAGHVLAIGDEARDIEAARSAGIASGAVTWGYATPEILLAHRPTFVFHSLEDISALARRQASAPGPEV